MKPYPRNVINYIPITPVYIKNNTNYKNSRYSTYRIIDNNPKRSLEIKLTNSITQNSTFNGYYYTTTENETLYQIAKKYYGNEYFYWIIAKTNNLKDDSLSVIQKGTTLIIPNFRELQKDGGYFSVNNSNNNI